MSHHKISAYNFFKGHPSTELLPAEAILNASQKVLITFNKSMAHYDGLDNTHPLNYGPDLGNLEVRTLLAQWNDKLFDLKSVTDPNCINLTNGASFGLANILQQCTYPFDDITKHVFMISPTYFLINSVFIDSGFAKKMSAIRELDDGEIDIESLEKQLADLEAQSPSKRVLTPKDIWRTHDPSKKQKKIYNYVLYVVPTFSNPKGGSFSDETKLKLIEIARKYNMLIVCDDVYELLDFSECDSNGKKNYHKRMVYIDRETLPEGELYGNVISNASFSKILGPGLRTGWQETSTPHLALALSAGGANMSGGTPGHLNTVIIGELLKSGEIDKTVEKLCQVLAERAVALKSAIEKFMPEGTKMSAIDGGYFAWITLPDKYDNQKIAKLCGEKGVIIATGDNFEVAFDTQGWGKHGVRVSISHLVKEDIIEGIRIWGDVCRKSITL